MKGWRMKSHCSHQLYKCRYILCIFDCGPGISYPGTGCLSLGNCKICVYRQYLKKNSRMLSAVSILLSNSRQHTTVTTKSYYLVQAFTSVTSIHQVSGTKCTSIRLSNVPPKTWVTKKSRITAKNLTTTNIYKALSAELLFFLFNNKLKLFYKSVAPQWTDLVLLIPSSWNAKIKCICSFVIKRVSINSG